MAANPDFVLREKHGARFEALRRAYESGEEREFERQLDELLEARERHLFVEIGKLSRDLDSALERFAFDARIVDLAEKDVPNARQRLAHVLELTDAAAHRTMDLVEGACPLAERTGSAAAAIAPLWEAFRERSIAVQDFRRLLGHVDRFLVDAQADSQQVRANLGEVLLAQGYQDLTGQIIRGVMHLVEEVEHALGDLVRLANHAAPAVAHRGECKETDGARFGADVRRGFGPPVPGVAHGAVVSGQQDVDSLLSGLGL